MVSFLRLSMVWKVMFLRQCWEREETDLECV